MSFEKIGNEIAFVVNGEVAYKSEAIGVILDRHLSVVKAHGPSSFVAKVFNDIENGVMAASWLPLHAREVLIDDMVCITGAFDIQELNTLMTERGSIDQFIQKETKLAEEKSCAIIESMMSGR